jgi:hypothetical protein
VTTVGATEQFEPEVAAWRPDGIGPDGKNHGYYASGSGFSYYFERPWYQNGVVDVYVENLKGLYAGLYNTSESIFFRLILELTKTQMVEDTRIFQLKASTLLLLGIKLSHQFPEHLHQLLWLLVSSHLSTII